MKLQTLSSVFPFLVLMLAAGCFPRECQEHANCVRTCDCLDSATQTSLPCAMTFLCEVETKSCEADYDMDCDAFCQAYAAPQVCGSKRCTLDAECSRTANCAVTGADGNTEDISCTQQFLCDNDVGVCESAYILDDTAFCELCLANATGG